MGILKGLFIWTLSDMGPYWFVVGNFWILITKIQKIGSFSEMGIRKGLFTWTLSDIMAPYWFIAGKYWILITKIQKIMVLLKKLILREPSVKKIIIQVSDLTLGPYFFLILTISRICLKEIYVFRMYFDKKNPCFLSVIFYLIFFFEKFYFLWNFYSF